MIVGFNPMVSNNKNKSQNKNIKFGDYFSAQRAIDEVVFKLASKKPEKQITKEQAIKILTDKKSIEDRIGQETIQDYIDALLGKKKKS